MHVTKKQKNYLFLTLLTIEALLALVLLTLGLFVLLEALYFSKDLLVQDFSLYIALGLLPCGVLFLLATVMLYRRRTLISHTAAIMAVVWLAGFVMVS